MNGELFLFLPCFCQQGLKSGGCRRASEVQVRAVATEACICRGNSRFWASENGAFADGLRRGCKYAIFEQESTKLIVSPLQRGMPRKRVEFTSVKRVSGSKSTRLIGEKSTVFRQKRLALPGRTPCRVGRKCVFRRFGRHGGR